MNLSTHWKAYLSWSLVLIALSQGFSIGSSVQKNEHIPRTIFD